MKAVRIDEVVTTASDGAAWIPLRAELGVRAFGLSAYVGDAGDVLVPRHSETRTPGGGVGGHEEVYVVTRGSASFAVDGETIDAPAGTCVFVEPGEAREAHALEPGTTVVAMGAPLGEPYRVAPWEYGARAGRARQLARIGELESVVAEGVATYGEHVTMLLGKACVAAQQGRRDEALDLLERAVADEDFGDWAREESAAEPLLDPVRNDARFPA